MRTHLIRCDSQVADGVVQLLIERFGGKFETSEPADPNLVFPSKPKRDIWVVTDGNRTPAQYTIERQRLFATGAEQGLLTYIEVIKPVVTE